MYYAGGRNNPALAARHEHLLRDARARWDTLELAGLGSEATTSYMQPSGPVITEHSLARDFHACKDCDARAQVALQQLLAAANCATGRLYLLRDGALVLGAACGVIREQLTEVALLLTQAR